MSQEEDFDVIIASQDTSTDAVVLTSSQQAEKWLSEALKTYDPANSAYSTVLSEGSSSSDTTISDLEDLADGAQSSLTSITQINAIIRKYINMDDIIGHVYDSVLTNVNAEYQMTWRNFEDNKSKTKKLAKVKALIEDFNQQINVERLICEAVPITYAEGNYLMTLRQKDTNWVVDYLPLGVGLISDYSSNGRPILLVQMSELKGRIRKTNLKNKKNQPLFYDDTAKEIQETFPQEVYDAYQANDTYAKLNPDYTGAMRINNMGRKYGVSPIFKALKPTLMLDTYANTDVTLAKSKAKKIIHQRLRAEVLGDDGTHNGFEIMAYAHQCFMQAWQNPTVVYTSPAAVEKIEYVESAIEDTSTDKVKYYRERVYSSLGINFLMSTEMSATLAKISLSQLMKNIDKIARQLEDVLNNWYKTVVLLNGYDLELCPTIHILNSEQMEWDMKKDLASFLFSTVGASYETTLDVLGYNALDEYQRRLSENEADYATVFAPHATSYTTSGDSDSSDGENTTGRPSETTDEDKQAYDDTYNQDAR
jgi:hypothetical protein